MAIQHGKAGQYGKGEARQCTRWMMFYLLMVCTFVSMAAGWLAGYAWGHGGGWAIVAVMFAVAVAARLAQPKFERYMDKLAKERIWYLRGGQIEGLVAWLLEEADDGWHIFNGIKLEAGSDLDHVVVGPGGVYCISTKSQRGLFVATPGGLLHNGRPCDFARQVLRQTMALRDRLAAVMGGEVPWVQAVLAVPQGYVDGDWRGVLGGKVWVVHQENLVDRLTGERVPARLDKARVRRLVDALTMLDANAAKVYRRPTTPAAAATADDGPRHTPA